MQLAYANYNVNMHFAFNELKDTYIFTYLSVCICMCVHDTYCTWQTGIWHVILQVM